MTDEWRDRAACKGLDTNIFFPTSGESGKDAKAVCDTCPVQTECLQASFHGNDDDLEHGVWAGLGMRPRRRIRIETEGSRQPHRRPQPIKHGTSGGYVAHQRHGVPICDACRDAYMLARRERREHLSVVRDGAA